MSDFLAFLNSADIDTLTQTPGITHPLAESLVAARPFASADDCLKVRGMGRNLLARLQSAFEAQGNAGEDRALIPVEAEAKPAPVAEHRAREQESFGSRAGAAFLNVIRAILRFLALVIVIAGIGAAIYFGAPYLKRLLVAPVEENTARIEALNAEVAALKEESAALQTQLDETRGRVDALEQAIAAHTASLDKLAEMQSALEAQMQEGDVQLRAEQQAGDEILAITLQRDITLTRTVEYLSRARLYLSQSNFGLARADVQSARDLLAGLQLSEPGYKPDAMKQALARLDLALGNLPAFPVIAVGDVDIALQMLLGDLPEAEPTPTMVATPTAYETALPTPTLVVDITPTPTAAP